MRTWLSPYAWVLGVRHFLYNTGIIPSWEFPDVPIICVGNLAVGGTGKTPMTEYLVELLLQKGKQPMVLSRGYGRKTKGFYYVEPHGDACRENGNTCRGNGHAFREAGGHLLWGDEPLQIKYRFPHVVVAVCEDRVAGVERLLADYPEEPWIILDDAMQHRRLKPSKTILMSNYNRPFWKDCLLPFGHLRDLPSAARRANCIVLTHCPHASRLTPDSSHIPHHPSPFTHCPHPPALPPSAALPSPPTLPSSATQPSVLSQPPRHTQPNQLPRSLPLTPHSSPLTPHSSPFTSHPSPLTSAPVFHTYMSYGKPIGLLAEASACTPVARGSALKLKESSSVLLVTGIANAKPLRDYVQLHYKLERHLNYPDHQVFSTRDLEKIKQLLQKNPSWHLVTTAKDAVRLMHSNIPGWVIPIEIRFFSEENATAFSQLVLSASH